MSIEKGKEIIRKKIVNLTNNPGVYKMLRDKNEILYVGKAKNIPNVKLTDASHFSAFDLVKYKKIIFTESSVKELEKRYQ